MSVKKYWLEYALTMAIRHIKEKLAAEGSPNFRPGYLFALEETLTALNNGASFITKD